MDMLDMLIVAVAVLACTAFMGSCTRLWRLHRRIRAAGAHQKQLWDALNDMYQWAGDAQRLLARQGLFLRRYDPKTGRVRVSDLPDNEQALIGKVANDPAREGYRALQLVARLDVLAGCWGPEIAQWAPPVRDIAPTRYERGLGRAGSLEVDPRHWDAPDEGSPG